MRIINLYQETLGIVSDCCKVSKEKIISSKKEECVNARYILVSILGEWYTDKKKKRLRCLEMAISYQLDTNYSFSNKLHR